MRLLIDTHVLLWAALDDPRLAGAQRSAYVDPDNDLLVSTATLWELDIKHALGKLPLPVSPRDFFAREIEVRGYIVLDVKRAHAERSAEQPYPRTRGTATPSIGCSSRRPWSRGSRFGETLVALTSQD